MDKSISVLSVVRCFSFLFEIEYNSVKTNSGDPDQTQRSVASDLGLHCLPMCNAYNMGQLVYLINISLLYHQLRIKLAGVFSFQHILQRSEIDTRAMSRDVVTEQYLY